MRLRTFMTGVQNCLCDLSSTVGCSLCKRASSVACLTRDTAESCFLLLCLGQQRSQKSPCSHTKRTKQHRAFNNSGEQVAADLSGRLAALRQSSPGPLGRALRGASHRRGAGLYAGSKRARRTTKCACCAACLVTKTMRSAA